MWWWNSRTRRSRRGFCSGWRRTAMRISTSTTSGSQWTRWASPKTALPIPGRTRPTRSHSSSAICGTAESALRSSIRTAAIRKSSWANTGRSSASIWSCSKKRSPLRRSRTSKNSSRSQSVMSGTISRSSRCRATSASTRTWRLMPRARMRR